MVTRNIRRSACAATRTTLRQRRAAAATIAVALTATLLAGLTACAPASGSAQAPTPARTKHATSTPRPGHTAAPGTATPSASPTPPPPPPTLVAVPQGTVVAEGNVASPKGSIHYHYRMVSNGDYTYSAEYSNFTSAVPIPVSVTLIDIPPQVGDGLTYHGVGDHPLGGPTTSVAPASSANIGTAPSYLAALVTYSSAASADGVPMELGPDKVLAVNAVRWSVPARQTNVHPVDTGARPLAGAVVTETTVSGAPASYRVGHGDLPDAVAQRFGITLHDLLWLNPGKAVFDPQQNLYEGTILNLDPESL